MMNNQTHIVISGQFAVGCAALLIAYIFYCVLHATDALQSAADAAALVSVDPRDIADPESLPMRLLGQHGKAC